VTVVNTQHLKGRDGASEAVPASPAGATPPGPGRPTDLTRRHTSMSSRVSGIVSSAWRPSLLLVALGVIWYLVSKSGLVAAYLVPSPGRTLETMRDNGPFLWDATLITLWETVLGFLLAALLGVVAAVVMVYSPTAERTLYPLLLFAQVIPKIAVAPLFVVWFGFGLSPKVVIAVLMAFFPVVISGVAGLRSVRPEILELADTMGASSWHTFTKIRFPASLPHLFSGLKVAATLAVTGAVVGEFVGSNRGLGYAILQANGNFDTPMLFGGLIIMSVMGILLFGLIALAEWLLLPWQPSRRTGNSITLPLA
jgi:NitT/TauT family transport system permease protein